MNSTKRLVRFLYRVTTILSLILIFCTNVNAQICADPANLIYGLTNAGTIHPITVSSGVADPQLNPLTGNPPISSNGIGYSSLNGKFYYFKRMPGSGPQEFVSFDPATNTTLILSNCPTANFVYVGGINEAGTGYYCWDSNATLFYYRISTNTWVTITSALVDGAGNDVDAIIRAHGSGDLAIDGLGNMLMLPSSNTKMALYRMNAPLPVAPVASITVTQLMPLTNPPAKFGGIALNASGQIFLNATAPANGLYRLESNMSLTFLSVVNSPMGDLTSCNFPFGTLAAGIADFKVGLSSSRNVMLSWKNNQNWNSEFIIQFSKDGFLWNNTGKVKSNLNTGKLMTYLHCSPVDGMNFYRLHYIGGNHIKMFSEIRSIEITNTMPVKFFPNPVHADISFLCDETFAGGTFSIWNASGNRLITSFIQGQRTVVPVKTLPPGQYILLIFHPRSGATKISKFVKK